MYKGELSRACTEPLIADSFFSRISRLLFEEMQLSFSDDKSHHINHCTNYKGITISDLAIICKIIFFIKKKKL